MLILQKQKMICFVVFVLKYTLKMIGEVIRRWQPPVEKKIMNPDFIAKKNVQKTPPL